jgi:hypothetical protein
MQESHAHTSESTEQQTNDLDQRWPDAVAVVGGPVMADGGTLTGHILTTVDSLTDQDQRGKRAYPRTADVLDLLLIERDESLTEICNELARLVKHGELYRPSGQTIAVTSPTDGDGLSDAEAAEILEGLHTAAEPALDDSDADELGQVIDHLRSSGEDIPVVVEDGDA